MDKAKADFQTIVLQQYQRHCISEGKEESTKDFLQYLMNRNFIRELDIKRFVVVTEYPKQLDNLGIKRSAMWGVEAKYDIPEPTIKTYLQRFQQYFKLKST